MKNGNYKQGMISPNNPNIPIPKSILNPTILNPQILNAKSPNLSIQVGSGLAAAAAGSSLGPLRAFGMTGLPNFSIE